MQCACHDEGDSDGQGEKVKGTAAGMDSGTGAAIGAAGVASAAGAPVAAGDGAGVAAPVGTVSSDDDTVVAHGVAVTVVVSGADSPGEAKDMTDGVEPALPLAAVAVATVVEGVACGTADATAGIGVGACAGVLERTSFPTSTDKAAVSASRSAALLAAVALSLPLLAKRCGKNRVAMASELCCSLPI